MSGLPNTINSESIMEYLKKCFSHTQIVYPLSVDNKKKSPAFPQHFASYFVCACVSVWLKIIAIFGTILSLSLSLSLSALHSDHGRSLCCVVAFLCCFAPTQLARSWKCVMLMRMEPTLYHRPLQKNAFVVDSLFLSPLFLLLD